jgi:Uma2 family endonuclease
MSAVTTGIRRITYEEYLALPDDGRRYELIDGELYVFAGPTIVHQLLSGELVAVFRGAVTLKGLGWVLTAPVELKFPGDNAVQPDIVVVLRDRAHVLRETRLEGAPTLVLKILSPSTKTYDLGPKAEFYACHGISEYWTVDPVAERIVVHELRDGRYVPFSHGDVVRSRVVPDLAVDAPALFAAAHQ